MDTIGRADELEPPRERDRERRWWHRTVIAVAAVRYVVPLAAIPLVPVLVPDRVALMVLLRPTKEFLLIGGAQHRITGAPSVWLLLFAFLPLMVVAVWAFFLVGRIYREPLATGDAPRWLQRAIPARRFAIAQAVLEKHGPAVAILGRIGALPPTVLAAAAGASHAAARRYLWADTAGALISFAMMVAAGYGLGRAWQEGASWLTLAGVGLFVGVLTVLARWFRIEGRAVDARAAATVEAAPDGDTPAA